MPNVHIISIIAYKYHIANLSYPAYIMQCDTLEKKRYSSTYQHS